MKQHLFFILALTLGISNLSTAQRFERYKITKVKEEDLNKKVYDLDSNASAVVLFDLGETEFFGNSTGGLSFTFTRHKRVHILNKNGYDAANVNIQLYYSSVTDQEKLTSVEGTTYNLENGKIVTSKLERRKGVFSEKLDEHHTLEKFTLPNVKEGAIIDYEYKISSDFIFNLQPWLFQTAYPTLWSELHSTIPDIFAYVVLKQGFIPYTISESVETNVSFTIRNENNLLSANGNVGRYSSSAMHHRWAIKDIPAYKDEPFTFSDINQLSRISFQYKGYQPPNGELENKMGDYPTAAKKLMAREDFGASISSSNEWMNKTFDPLLANATTPLAKAKIIYNYVRDQFTCTDQTALYLTNNSLKEIFQNKKGNVAEINILLTAILVHYELTAYPIILSTRSNGYTHEQYPLMEKFNYVVSGLQIDENKYYLDASDPLLGFNHLPLYCYNFHARAINESAKAISLPPDSVQESKLTSIYLTEDKGVWTGSFSQKNSYYNSYEIRESVKEKGKTNFFENIRKHYNIEGLTFKDSYIDSLNELEENVVLNYEFSFKPESEEMIYLNPMFDEGQSNNPFKAAERLYPVELPYGIDEVYLLNIDVPENYKVEEIPKSIKMLLGDTEGFFEYIVSEQGKQVQLRSRIKLPKARYHPDAYEALRQLFAQIVKKHSEQIILKKIK